MKSIHIIIGIVFIIFAILQYNDPDYYIWIPVYSLISFIAFSTAARKPQRKLALWVTLFLAAWSVTFIPDLVSWIQDGAPNIAGSMKAETPHIELMRELFGLIISLVATVYYATKK
ncbi:MAG: transmembrane 220 family protein [Saprospiraceae bacterium]|nr:transmembrane 220 family protein [Saprospiraceae bacterium]|tara:strand:- start:1729 stop:2076 length:348 start_codon:yes stop_codon:yes gene_type:complete